MTCKGCDDLSAAQVGVIARGPIGARRGENVQIDGVFQSFSAVGNVGRDAERVAGTKA